jgi:hypothetical protein
VVKKELMEKGCYVCGCQETPSKKASLRLIQDKLLLM